MGFNGAGWDRTGQDGVGWMGWDAIGLRGDVGMEDSEDGVEWYAGSKTMTVGHAELTTNPQAPPPHPLGLI